ncbi:phage tail tape measure protein [Pseudaminobacter sp. NGMCC 1.201702]|uniref:phage tail tape measure protein n=1 Tax=Pseudaminobacter sp. NGMCC 1.201702 TaxID=3391825 RepID=UPI0039EDEC88
MADVAVLGLEVRSDQVEKGTRALDRLTNSAKRAQAASDGITVSTKNAGAVAKAANSNWESYDQTVGRLGIRTKQTAAATKAATSAVNGQAAAVSNAAKRADVATRSYGAFAAVLRTVSGIVGNFALNAVSVAVGVLMAELGKLVDWAGLAVSALHMLADAIEIIAPYAAMAAAGLALVYAPAIIGGIVSLIGLLGQLSLAALGLAASFAAANPAATFVLGLTAAVAAANVFRDELAQIFGRDIVGDAKNAVNFIIGAFVGGYDAVVAAWNSLPAAFGDLGYQAANKFIEGINWMVGEVVSIVNGLIAKINGGIRGAVGALGGDAANAVQLKDLGSPQSFKMGGIANPYAGSAGAAAGAARQAFAGAQGVDYVGQIGGAISSMASSAADKLRGLAGSFGGVEDAAGKAGGAAKGAADKAKDAWAGLRGAVDKVSDGMKFARDVVGGFVSDLRAGLKNGESFWESFKNAASKAIDKIVDKLINNMLDAIFQVGSAAGGGGGGFLGGLFSFLGFANGGVFQGGRVTPFARGGVVSRPTLFPMANGAGLMGEAGPEAIMPLRRGPDGRLGVTAANGNAQPQKLHVTVGVSVDDDGKIKAYVTDMGQKAAQAGASVAVKQVNQSLPSMIANAQSRSM